jgi:hypothetical protein
MPRTLLVERTQVVKVVVEIKSILIENVHRPSAHLLLFLTTFCSTTMPWLSLSRTMKWTGFMMDSSDQPEKSSYILLTLLQKARSILL